MQRGEVPHDAKTGGGPILLTISFPYVRDWINTHPFRNSPDASLICNTIMGAPVKPEAMWTMMHLLKKRILKMLDHGMIKDEEERQKILSFISTKKWNPYCLRHSSISSDSDFLPEYALKKKVRWVMNSKQGARYIKARMGNDLKQKILEHNGIVSGKELKLIPTILKCGCCNLMNGTDNKYCSKCSYPLIPSAFEELKDEENRKFEKLEKKFEAMNGTLQSIFSTIQDMNEKDKGRVVTKLIQTGIYQK